MQYVAYLLLIAVIFGLVALVDFLLKIIFPRRTEKAVRLPRYSFILGLIMTLLAVIVLLFTPIQEETLLLVGGIVAILMGGLLLFNFFRTALFYSEENFEFRSLTGSIGPFRYEDITGQRSFLSRGGIQVILYANGKEIQLYQAMQGLDSFLNTAFFAWCKAKGIDPDTVDYDPRTLRYFPEPEA